MKYVNSSSNSFLPLSVHITAIKNKVNRLMPCEMSLVGEISARFLQCYKDIKNQDIKQLTEEAAPKAYEAVPTLVL